MWGNYLWTCALPVQYDQDNPHFLQIKTVQQPVLLPNIQLN